jgi:pyridoxal phosphate enzyme (YggS family)
MIGEQISEAEVRYNRKTGSVKLLAVSKRHSVDAIRECLQYRQTAFGENYAQELHDKASEIKENIEWHYIGPIQSNKTRMIAEVASWVHTIDRLKVARRLSDQLPDGKPPLSVCLQVNISGEASKAGVKLQELPALASEIAHLPGLTLRGLMAIPAPEQDFSRQREVFARVREAQEGLIQSGYDLDTLSMGMSGDMDAAIAEGATIVRIGTAIFGQRPV